MSARQKVMISAFVTSYDLLKDLKDLERNAISDFLIEETDE